MGKTICKFGAYSLVWINLEAGGFFLLKQIIRHVTSSYSLLQLYGYIKVYYEHEL